MTTTSQDPQDPGVGQDGAGRVAVVLRTKDRPVFLARALASVHAQTHQDLVVWIVNDGGDPETVEAVLAASPAAGDPRFEVLHHDRPRGRSEALNAGIAAGHDAAYLAIHDDDDSWDPRFLDRTVSHLVAHPAAGAVGTRCQIVREVVDGDDVVEVGRETLSASITEATLIEMAWSNFLPPICLVVRRSAFEETGGFDPSLPVLEDWDFTLRLMSRYPVGFLPEEPLAFWHHRAESEGSAGNSVYAEAGDHARYDVLIRDSFLRGERSAASGGLGAQLASAYYLRRISDNADRARAQMSATVDQWGRGHNEHLSVVATEINLRLGRLRGEVVALRDRTDLLEQGVTRLEATRPAALEASVRPLVRRINRLSRQVDDLWGTSRPVSRLRRRRKAQRQAAREADGGS